jgi:predicted nucleic acid-binding Zn ribbon protein
VTPDGRDPRDTDPESPSRRRRPQRVGDLLPDAARHLGLEDELRLARATTTWDALVAERVPAAAGACRLVRIEPDAVVVAVDEPIVAAELRMRALELLSAFGAAPGGAKVRLLRLVGGAGSGAGGSASPRV